MSISRVRDADASPLSRQSTADETGTLRPSQFSTRQAAPGKLAGLNPRMARGSGEPPVPLNVREIESASPLDSNLKAQWELATMQSYTNLIQTQCEAIKAGSAAVLKATERT